MPSVLVTGANRGIGLNLARQYLADGWTVFATARNPAKADGLSGLSGDLSVEALEATDWDGVTALAKKLKGVPLDVLFNNAGMMVRDGITLGELDPVAWQQILVVNAIAPIKMTEEFVEHVAAGDQKKVAFVSSFLGSIGSNTWGGRYPYSTSKAALNMGVASLTVDLRPRGISVVTMHPGHVRTDMGGATAPVLPEDSARGMRAVVDGLTPERSGSFINYDGGAIPW